MNGGKPGEQRDRRRITEDIAATAVVAVVVSVLLVEADVATMDIMIAVSQWAAIRPWMARVSSSWRCDYTMV